MPKILLDIPQSTIDAFDAGWRATSARSRSGLMVKVLNEWAELAQSADQPYIPEPYLDGAVSGPPAVVEPITFASDAINLEWSGIKAHRVGGTWHEPWCIQAREPSLPCNCGAERRAGK